MERVEELVSSEDDEVSRHGQESTQVDRRSAIKIVGGAIAAVSAALLPELGAVQESEAGCFDCDSYNCGCDGVWLDCSFNCGGAVTPWIVEFAVNCDPTGCPSPSCHGQSIGPFKCCAGQCNSTCEVCCIHCPAP